MGTEVDGVALWSATRLAAALAAKELSSRELLAVYLDRIARLDGSLNSVVTLDAERALADAGRADELTARGASTGPLHGLPITIKDAIETAGIRSTGGANELSDHVPEGDAPAVASLKAAGAIVFGKTNLPRWSGDLQTFNDLFGTTNNPWDVRRTPGGSSGGPAVAVACGFTSFELGTDIGGSVRIPSHFCGIYGLKPSFGVVPQRGYLDQVGGGTTDADLNVFGPMARSADDLDLILSVMAGPAPERAAGWRLELPPPRHEHLRSYKIGVWFEQPECPLDPDILGVLSDAVDVAAASGVRIERARPPVDFAEQTALFLQLIAAALSPSAEPELQDAMAGGHAAWLAADRQRARLQRAWAEWFGTYDLLLCPVTPTAAFPHCQADDVTARTLSIAGMDVPYVNHVMWTGLIGVVGLPAAVPPIGRTPSGLPVGVQVVAPFLRDRDAVHAAGELADLVGGGFTPPPGF